MPAVITEHTEHTEHIEQSDAAQTSDHLCYDFCSRGFVAFNNRSHLGGSLTATASVLLLILLSLYIATILTGRSRIFKKNCTLQQQAVLFSLHAH